MKKINIPRHALVFGILFVSFLLTPAVGKEKPRGLSKKKTAPLILVINYPYQIWSTTPTKIHVCLFKPDFTPAENAEVIVDGKRMGKADKNGVFIFELQPGSRRIHTLQATLEGKTIRYQVTKSFRCNSRTVSFKSHQIYVYTDRGVYNPGQDILIRCIAWKLKGDYKPLSKAKIQVLLQNSQGKIFTGGWLTTNAYGVAAMKIPLSDNMPKGSYNLVVVYQKAREVTRLRIRRFVAPILKINHNLKRFLTKSQKSLPIKVDLSYFSGGKIKGSILHLRVFNAYGKEVFQFQPVEKAPGVYAFVLSEEHLAKIRKGLQAERAFQIKLKATDSYGRSDTVTRDMVYTTRPYRAVLELDKDDYPAGEMVKLLVKVVDLDGKPAVNIPLSLSVSAFKIALKSKTDKKGVGLFSFKMGKTSATAIVKSPIMTAVLGRRALVLNRPKPMVSKVEDPTNKVGIQTFIQVKFGSKYIPIEKVVHVDLTDISGALVTATTIPVFQKNGKYTAKGKITSPTWGTMLVNLYCCATLKSNSTKAKTPLNVGFITEGQKITLYPNQELSLTIENFKPRAKPGEKMNFIIKVKTKKGQEACLGASVVDSAVLSLLNPFEKTPADRFFNPQLKVIASSGAGVLTWPVVDRNWGSPWRDIAYSNWGWKRPGGVRSSRNRGGIVSKGNGGGGGPGGKVEGASGYTKATKKKPAKMVIKNTNKPPSPSEKFSAPKLKEAKKKNEGGLSFGGKDEDGKKSPRKTHRKPRSRSIITIRKKFPETSLWEPLWITKKGVHKLAFTLPDSITIQRLSVVASDKQGRIGLLQKNIQVGQDLFVRSGLPAVITLGDTITVSAYVRNFSGKEQNCTVSLVANSLAILSGKTVKLKIGTGDTGIASWKIKASQCGSSKFTVLAKAGTLMDSEVRSLFVQPSGEALTAVQKGLVQKTKSWKGVIKLNPTATYHTAFLNVSFPNVIPALQGVEYMARYPHGCVEQISSVALTNIAVLEYGLRHGISKKKITWLRNTLKYTAAKLAVMQTSSGGWGWFYGNRKTNAYLTGYALRTLTEIRSMDIVVSPKVIDRAMAYLLKCRNNEGLWSSKNIFFWETTNKQTDIALSAELFALLTKSARFQATKKYDNQLGKLKKIMVQYLKKKPLEPLAIANAVSGLLTWSKWKKDKSLAKLLGKSVEYLIRLKRQAYWEPHWYHAYGGMVELNARILELLSQVDSTKYQAFIREGLTYLLSTREAFGAWHNTMGTASAVRAILKFGNFEKEIPSEVSIRINGKEVKNIKIDPKDPFLSAVSLRYLEITSYLKKSGENKIEVIYNGNLKAPVILKVNQWGLPQKQVARAIQLKRRAPNTVSLGDPLSVTLEISSEKAVPFVVVEEKIPSNMAVDMRSLKKLKEKGLVADYKVKGSIFFYFNSIQAPVLLKYRLTALRIGTALHPGTTARPMYSASQTVAFQGGVITVK